MSRLRVAALEAAQCSSSESFSSMFGAAPIGAALLGGGRAGTVELVAAVNPALRRISGRCRADWLALDAPAQALGLAREVVREMFDGHRESFADECRLVQPDGARVPVFVSLSVIGAGGSGEL